MRTIELIAPSGMTDPLRVDKFIGSHVTVTRSQLKHRLAGVRINGRSVRISHFVRAGDRVEVDLDEPVCREIRPEKIDLDILFENDDVIVLNKPQGMVVHPAAGHYNGTLIQGIQYYVGDLRESFGGDALRPGIVHRLDKETSGVIIVARSVSAHEHLAAQFRNRTVGKTYLAVVRGIPSREQGRIESRLVRDPRNRKRFAESAAAGQGKRALTFYRVVKKFDGYSFLLLKPKTGRTHQLRVHMRSLGSPIVGDPVYGIRDGRFPDASLMLHAYRLELRLPGEQDPSRFTAPLPARFRILLRDLREGRQRRD